MEVYTTTAFSNYFLIKIRLWIFSVVTTLLHFNTNKNCFQKHNREPLGEASSSFLKVSEPEMRDENVRRNLSLLLLF